MTVFFFKVYNSPCPDYINEVACTGKTESEARDVAADLCTRTAETSDYDAPKVWDLRLLH